MRNGFTIAPRFDPNAHAVVFEGDCRELLRQIPAGAIQLVVTSPPYNLGKEYESRLDLDDYLSQQPVHHILLLQKAPHHPTLT